MSNTFASGGLVTSGTITCGNNFIIKANLTNASSSFSQIAKQSKKVSRILNEINKDHNYCNHRRGGPRSKIFCEVPKSVPHDFHTGRSSGRWFSWNDKEWD